MLFQGVCRIVDVGPTASGQTEVKLQSEGPPQAGTGFAETWFLSSPKVSREVLATALAAVTSNRTVFCEIPDSSTPYSEVARFIIVN